MREGTNKTGPGQDELQNGPAPLPSSSLDPKLIADEEEIEKFRR